MGRPEIPIDEKQVRKLAERGWSVRQIAAHFEVDEATIRRRFAAAVEESRHHGQAKLLDVLWQRGIGNPETRTGGDNRVLLHLADRILGKIPQKIEITREQAIEFLEQDLKSRGIEVDQVTEGVEKPDSPPDV